MIDELTQVAMTTWAAKDLPARLYVCPKWRDLLNCKFSRPPEDVAIGQAQNPNAVKFFSAVELIALLADREWLDDITKTIGQFWKQQECQAQLYFKRNPPCKLMKGKHFGALKKYYRLPNQTINRI